MAPTVRRAGRFASCPRSSGCPPFQDQQPGRVPEPLRVGGGARHGYERDVRADGFQPERDFDAFSLSADGCPKGSPSEQPPVRKAAITNKTESFLIIVRFAVSQPVEIRFDAPPTGMSMIRSQCSPARLTVKQFAATGSPVAHRPPEGRGSAAAAGNRLRNGHPCGRCRRQASCRSM